ncbi:unnamed protein product [Protopolystoma xenopodis]|uniref:Uncharacterized protein n=1 Tax=Protopolystoma xenopodis TaxID=117903 RepID=A0A3S5B5T5_9PLAT|nr:unnamed protein product [Protopolystoma xenopodis]
MVGNRTHASKSPVQRLYASLDSVACLALNMSLFPHLLVSSTTDRSVLPALLHFIGLLHSGLGFQSLASSRDYGSFHFASTVSALLTELESKTPMQEYFFNFSLYTLFPVQDGLYMNCYPASFLGIRRDGWKRTSLLRSTSLDLIGASKHRSIEALRSVANRDDSFVEFLNSNHSNHRAESGCRPLWNLGELKLRVDRRRLIRSDPPNPSNVLPSLLSSQENEPNAQALFVCADCRLLSASFDRSKECTSALPANGTVFSSRRQLDEKSLARFQRLRSIR